MSNVRSTLMAAGMAALVPGHVLADDPATVDWKSVPSRSLTLFWPGQSSYQWLRGSAHPGAKMVAKDVACATCHKGAEEKLGNKLVTANKLEPMPVEGKNGVVKLSVQVAYDAENAYFRARWKTRNPYPGEAHPFLRFDGKQWKQYGYPKLDKVVQDGKQPGIYEDRFSIMIDDGSVPGFATQGCWVSCHDGSRDMPNLPAKATVQGNAMFAAIKKNDVRKYLPATRTDALASWDKGKSLDEINKLKADGAILDLMQWRAHRSNPVGMADDFYVLEYR
ncbi:MAG: ethylbenzene dehydrogenase-related protein, partial [Betaproteobacteria bacterium]|nr:ethylbenzene dehydrogenase-related protein [Betaproteobacteria bacterium]